MPIFSLLPATHLHPAPQHCTPRHSSPRPRRPHKLAALLLLALTSAASAQVLAHPGWTRSNFAAEPWYQRAVFYQVHDAAPDFKGLADRLDAIQSTGIDAIIVTPPALPTLAGASAEQAIAAQAALDAFDNFTRQATARGIRVLAALPAAHADADLAGRIRFWLTRGVAGLRLEIPADTSAQDRIAIAASARTIAGNAAGQRVVLVDAENGNAASSIAASNRRIPRPGPAQTAPQLQVTVLTSPLTASALRPQLTATLATRDTLLDTRPRDGGRDAAPLAQALATLALAANPAALIDPAQPLALPASIPQPEPVTSEEAESAKISPPPAPPQPPAGVYLPYIPYVPPPRPMKKAAPAPPAPTDPFTAWVAKLAALHHSNVALRTGSKTVLDFDAQNVLVWVARPASPMLQNPPVVVLCNLSAQPVELSLSDAMKKLTLRGFFLRKLLRSDDAMGAQDIQAVKLAPYSVFIGELRR